MDLVIEVTCNKDGVRGRLSAAGECTVSDPLGRCTTDGESRVIAFAWNCGGGNTGGFETVSINVVKGSTVETRFIRSWFAGDDECCTYADDVLPSVASQVENTNNCGASTDWQDEIANLKSIYDDPATPTPGPSKSHGKVYYTL